MRKTEQTTEPSIEEILASIRRIIADDGSPAPAPVATPVFEHPQRDEPGEEPRAADKYSWDDDAFGGERPFGGAPSEDEILELTDDFLIEETEPASAAAEPLFRENRGDAAADFAPADGNAALRTAEYREYAEDVSASSVEDDPSALDAPGMIAMEAPLTSEGLDSVLSNVVAEMHRLSEGRGLELAQGFDAFEDEDPRMAEPAWQQPAIPVPQTQGLQAPVQQAAGLQAAAPQAPAQRPVWSARHRDGDSAPARGARPLDAPRRDSPARTPGDTGTEAAPGGMFDAASGAGPGTPFFGLPGETRAPAAKAGAAETAAPHSPGGARPELDRERKAVGDLLSRAFSEAPEFDGEGESASGTGLEAKAEELAKEAVSEFAADKLSAPPVAHALRADKPFMAEITTSLAGALARSTGRKGDAMSPAGAPELPDDELAPDMEPGSGMDAETSGHASAAEAAEVARGSLPATAMDIGTPGPGRGDGAGQNAHGAAVKAVPVTPAVHASPVLTVQSLPEGLEAAVVELLKPLVRQWLNDNLPRLVEKAVREEIAASGALPQRGGRTGGAHG